VIHPRACPRVAHGRWVGALTRRTLALVVMLAGCAGRLPYQPERQPFGATISADVRVTEDRLRVEIGSEGYRVERAVLVRNGDAEIAPEAVVPSSVASGGLSIGLGVGAEGWGSGGSYAVGTGIGILPARSSTTWWATACGRPSPRR
jgi:hypothetical protein